MSDQRSGARWPTCLKGQVRARDGRVIDCLVRDFSDSGARIELNGSATLPHTFDLFFPLRQATFRAQVRWRGENEIGLTFENPESAPTDPVQARLVQRVLQLEAENAELRTRLAELLSHVEHVS
jgi:PilZ domain